MSDKTVKKFEIAAYCAIIVLSIVACTALIKKFILTPSAGPSAMHLPVGKSMALDHDWTQSDKTLVLVLSETCQFCNESAPFYQTLLTKFSDRRKVQFVAVFPQEVVSATKHLNALGLSMNEVKQSVLASLGVNGTPTLILVDNTGRVIDSWMGKLSPDEELRVIERIRV
jgi:thioredoxin-related protein